MTAAEATYRDQALEELDRVPSEYLPTLLKLIRAFREGVTLPSAEDSFQQGWSEAMAGDTRPVSELWDGIDGR